MVAVLLEVVLMAIGGSLGAIARYLTTLTAQRFSNATWPGTLLINAVGSGVFGFSIAAFGGIVAPALQIGFLGAFTTFSMFMLETHSMYQDRKGYAFLYSLSSVVICVVFYLLGLGFLGTGFSGTGFLDTAFGGQG